MLTSFLHGDLNVVEFLKDMLMSLPGILVALSLHEAAHGYAAYRLGDPTARNMGRVSVNPLRHIDPVGFASMILVGVGWAKPVPVNPRYFKNPRRDDLIVSMAGITANLLQFLLGACAMMAFVAAAIGRIPAEDYLADGYFKIATAEGLFKMLPSEAFLYAGAMREMLIVPVFGAAVGVAYEIIVNYAVINIALAAFNILPIPPLDGYHLFNDLLFKRRLFAPVVAQRIGQGLLLVLLLTGFLSKGINFVVNGSLRGVGMLFGALLT